jgi:DNA-binding NtrC family response regulator
VFCAGTSVQLQAEIKENRGAKMAKIVTVGLDPTAALQLGKALGPGNHEIAHKPSSTIIEDVIEADIVFADGNNKHYLSLLKLVRATCPSMPFVVVTRIPETSDWLDALEAGATDYCSAPFEPRQMNWLMESALSEGRNLASV